MNRFLSLSLLAVFFFGAPLSPALATFTVSGDVQSF